MTIGHDHVQQRNLKQKATNWVSTADGFGGYTYTAPVVLDCRWETRFETFRDSQGEEVTSNALVYLSADVKIGSYLFEGVSTAVDPTTLSEARRVRQFNKLTDLRNIEVQRLAFL